MSLLNWGVDPNHPAVLAAAPKPKPGLAFLNMDHGTYYIEFDGQTLGHMQGERGLGGVNRYSSNWSVYWGPYRPDGRGNRIHWSGRLHSFKAAKAFVREHIDAIREGEAVS